MLQDSLPGSLACVAWAGPVAHVWSWLPPVDAPATERASWMPETLLRPRGDPDGTRLLASIEGVEGQVWRGGGLVASQWWPGTPGADAWRRFLRSAGIAPEGADGPPAVSDPGLAAPWARVRGATAGPDLLEAVAWRVSLGVVALALGWQLTALGDERDAHSALLARSEALRVRAMPLLDARERADAARTDVERLRLLQRASSDYSLMPALTIPLGDDARLLGWQRQGDVLKAKLAVSDTDPRHVVAAYTGVALLANVQATPLPPAAVGLEFKLPETFGVAETGESRETSGTGTE